MWQKIRKSILGRIQCAERNPIVYNVREYTQNERIRSYVKTIVAPFEYLRTVFRRRISVNGREGLAFVLIAKNEAPYIEEWIKFHHKQGVSHFFIYDNESEDNLREVLTPYIERGLVTYRLLKGRRRQIDAYNKAIHTYGRKFRYMAFLDADEFVFVRDENYRDRGFNLYDFVDDFMKSHENAGGLAVHWLVFGSSGHKTKPKGGVLENYTMSTEQEFENNRFVKTICDPLKVRFFVDDPHYPIYFRGFFNLDENGEKVQGSVSKKITFDKVRINHYFTKSLEEYILKKNRGKADRDGLRSMEDFYENDQNILHDTEILSHM
ncbi:MAG: glycosyltransferase family 2 protein [Synergistaceae bacterium]|nr:glycosyltransferase family 2 protein [Synergistaceae bacterium]MBQ3759153.1 glycosyltransferase family 2 protein [Synergistaceae bacterium]MBQ6665602.1 glycosyltransferase family 2 protein [Synergistaceae bacterium]MBQ6982215.1 glycosyltransferase family 2 protein [Synergistaceae bacterium]MBR0247697.1 glycosyltransferase family 2 protein [Synergistaceae bacterium]